MLSHLLYPQDINQREKNQYQIVDATWSMPHSSMTGEELFKEQHLKGAVHFDINKVANLQSPLPHTVPTLDVFAKFMVDSGLSSERKTFIFDGNGLFSACRVWWLFNLFDLNSTYVLGGSRPQWYDIFSAQKGPQSVSPTSKPTLTFQKRYLSTTEDVLKSIDSTDTLILDARSQERFSGFSLEPRVGLRSGHIPSSKNLPFFDLIDKEKIGFHEYDILKAKFLDIDSDFQKKHIILTCGSGVTACILALGLAQIGHDNWSVYDGSWAQWGADHDLPIETA